MKAKILKAAHKYEQKYPDCPIPLVGDERITVQVKWGYCPDDSEELKAEMGTHETVTLSAFGDDGLNCLALWDTNGIVHYLTSEYFSRAEKKRVMDVLMSKVLKLKEAGIV